MACICLLTNAVVSPVLCGKIKSAGAESQLVGAGFSEVSIRTKEESASFIKDWMPNQGEDPSKFILSAVIQATKPPVAAL